MTAGAIGVVGLSHLGTVVSACLAADGHTVTAVDADGEVVAAVAAGRPHLHEPGLAELLAARPPAVTTDYAALAGADLVIVAVDTVTDTENRSSLAGLERHLERAAPWLPGSGALVLMSQVPVGYTRALAERLRAASPRCRLYYWVETLVIGEAVARYRAPERVILGSAGGGRAPEPVLDPLLERFGCPVLRMDWESAELAKAAINVYLALSVTYANLLADLCEATGASMRAVIPALRSDPRIGPHAYLRPGLGIAGGNLERDLVHLRTLAERAGVDPALPRLVLDASARRYGWLRAAVDRAVAARGAAPRLALWGLAYKKDTASTKNSLAVRLIDDMEGRATVAAYDPRAALPAPRPWVDPAPSAAAALDDADALVVLTDWDEFRGWDPAEVAARLRAPLVVDPVGVFDPAAARRAGLTYLTVGERP